MREFNILGPVYPQYHYHVDRVAVKAILREKVEKGRYFTLNAARQIGKTTLFQEIIAELEATGEYIGILLDFESLTDFGPTRTYEMLALALREWREVQAPSAPEPSPMRDHGDFIQWLKETGRVLQKRVVLIIDEFEAVPTEISTPILSQFRAMYLKRYEPKLYNTHSILLVGVQTIAHMLGGTQSPFNIADQYTVPYFTEEESGSLLTQHTEATGQIFEQSVLDSVFAETGGQPFLVNRLGQLLTDDPENDHSKPITQEDFDYALAKLVNENNTNFYTIRSKAKLHKSEVLEALFNNTFYYDFQDEVTQELLMFGVLRVHEDQNGVEYARIANPIYQKILVKAFAPTHSIMRQVVNGNMLNRFVVDNQLHLDHVMDSFKDFMEEHGVRLLKSEATNNPLEISGQYLLLSYLSAILRTVGGFVTVESLSTAGEIDLAGFFRDQRFIIETKVWYGNARYEEGLEQLANYLRAAGLHKGYMVIFDNKKENNTLLAKKGDVFELVFQEKTLRVYLIGVTV